MKSITIKSFGKIQEVISEDIEVALEGETIQDLKDHLIHTYPKLADVYFNIAMNKNIVSDTTIVEDQSEIALLPPYSGG
jgi:molybdopterin synthase sulfur carrier subunit